MRKTQIETPKEVYITDYPRAVELAQQQTSIIWFAEELGVEKDENDIRTKCTAGERHGITTVLKLFTEYELSLGGDEYWGGKVSRMFPRPDIQRMAATFAFIELGVHAPFYSLINEALGIATEEFYTSWKDDPVLRERMAFVGKYADNDCPLLSTAAFAFMEGCVLFSNFAFLKSFNTRGHNLIPHITAGIDASAKDEFHHAVGAAWLYNQCLAERQDLGLITPEETDELCATILEIAEQVYEHEARICDLIYSEGDIRTISKDEVLHFVRDRINVILGMLGIGRLYEQEDGVVSGWFYDQLNSFKYSDFFTATQIQYKRNWAKHKLKFNPEV